MTSLSCIRVFFTLLLSKCSSFCPDSGHLNKITGKDILTPKRLFDKVFEEEGVLGKGITVGKIQVSLLATDRGRTSIFGDLERKARATGGSNAHLALLAKVRVIPGLYALLVSRVLNSLL